MPHLLEKFLNGCSSIIPKEETINILTSKIPCTIKFGADPSAPDLHLGHLVILNKLRLLQEMGHIVLFIIGDFTAKIGDPTGKSETRKALTNQEVQQNATTYQNQIFKILLKDKTKILYNSDWLSKLTAQDIIELSAKTTVARMLEREDFSNRYKNNIPISIHEFLYPLLQGYDSVHLKNDIEIGGTDQTFNLLMGRQLQQSNHQKPQSVITFPILEGLDGVKKMSKSLNNHIGITEDANQIFGKIMSIPDNLIIRYNSLLLNPTSQELNILIQKFHSQDINPKDLKIELAEKIVTLLHSSQSAQKAKENFQRIFTNKQNPEEMPEINVKKESALRLDQILLENNILSSKKEFQRLITQRAISIDNKKITDIFYNLSPQKTQIIKIGKRKFFKINII